MGKGRKTASHFRGIAAAITAAWWGLLGFCGNHNGRVGSRDKVWGS